MAMSWQNQPPHRRRITAFLLAAIVVHSLVLFSWSRPGVDVRPEIPDWVNIRLVAGIDESVNRDTVVRPEKIPLKQKSLEDNKANERQAENEKPDPPAQAQSENFVKADSRPYEYENPKPFYPAAARRRGMQGTVLLELAVDIHGKVSRTELKRSSGYRLLDEAAIDTVRGWRFIPAKKNDRPVDSVVEVPVRFSLQEF